MRFHLILGALGLGLSAGAALADERLDAADAMVNCAAIANDAYRLACYDAAAGRLRVVLGASGLASPRPTPGTLAPSQPQDRLIADYGTTAGAPAQPALAPPAAQPSLTAPQPQTQTWAPSPAPQPQTQAAVEGDDGVSLFGITLWGSSSPKPATAAAQAAGFGEEQVQKPKYVLEAEGADPGSMTAMVRDVTFTPTGDAIVFLENGHVWRQTDGPQLRFPKDPQERRVTISRALLGNYRMTVGDSNRAVNVRRVK